MSLNNELPSWLEPLFRGPIKVEDDTDENDLKDIFSDRMEVLLRIYGCDATPDGWKYLAIQLSLYHTWLGTPVFPIETSSNRSSKSPGRPADPQQGKWIALMRQELREKPSLSVKEAAALIKKVHKSAPSVARLQNLMSDARRKRKPILPKAAIDTKILKALYLAAESLESRSRK